MSDRVVLSAESTLHELVRLGVRPYLPSGTHAVALPPLPSELDTFRNIGSLGVEFRLGEQVGLVDFAWSQQFEGFTVPTELRDVDPWQRVAAVTDAWRAGEVDLACANSVMYEIDQQGAQLGSCPAIFFTHAPSPDDQTLAFLRATQRLLDHGEVVGREQSVAAVLQALQPGALMVGHGYMLSRPGTPLRLMVVNVGPLASLERFLVALKWQGDINLVTETMSKLSGSLEVCDLALSLDAGEGIGERIGVELILHRQAQDPAMQLVLDELVAAGLCHRNHRITLDTWTALDPATSPQLSAFAPVTGAHHRVSHIKITFGPKGVEAKGYLECCLPGTHAAYGQQVVAPSEPQ